MKEIFQRKKLFGKKEKKCRSFLSEIGHLSNLTIKIDLGDRYDLSKVVVYFKKRMGTYL
jgi:hypothetical protein